MDVQLVAMRVQLLDQLLDSAIELGSVPTALGDSRLLCIDTNTPIAEVLSLT